MHAMTCHSTVGKQNWPIFGLRLIISPFYIFTSIFSIGILKQFLEDQKIVSLIGRRTYNGFWEMTLTQQNCFNCLSMFVYQCL